MNDQLIFEANGRIIGFETSAIHKILETDRLYFLPGQSGIVAGIVTLSGEPVTVLDTFALLSLKSRKQIGTEFHKIIVLKEEDRLLGFDIGSTEISFILEREAQEDDTEQIQTLTQDGAATQFELNGREIESIDWLSYFNITAEILSTEQANG